MDHATDRAYNRIQQLRDRLDTAKRLVKQWDEAWEQLQTAVKVVKESRQAAHDNVANLEREVEMLIAEFGDPNAQ